MNALTATLKTRWAALQASERRMLIVAACVVRAALVWWIGVAPALKTLRQFETSDQQISQQLEHMQSMRQQALALKDQKVNITPANALRSLQGSTKSLLGELAQLQIVEDRATVRFQNANPAHFSQWVTQARESARAMPVQADITRSGPASAPLWSGTVILMLASE